MSSSTQSAATGDRSRANPVGAYIATLGSLLLAVSMWFNWVGLGPSDSEQDFSSGYEADSLIPFMGLLGIGFSLALLYAASRADRRQHRGLSLASFAVGLASFLWILFFLIDPIETVKYSGAQGEDAPNVTTSWGVWVGLIGALIWALGSILLAKEPEGDVENDHTVVRQTTTQPVQTQHLSEHRVEGYERHTVDQDLPTGYQDNPTREGGQGLPPQSGSTTLGR